MAPQSKIEIVLSAVDKGLTSGFQRALGAVRSFGGQAKAAGSGIDAFSRSITGLVGSLAATVSAAAGMQKLVTVTREFDKISAGLITATGSAEKSEQAFAAIQDFAAKTPYDLGQVADSFVKLVNYGLDPSERALTSYGNTASALGKDLNQMIEAVADAATGEFERLKEFGIKSRQEGDKVSFTFRGVTTTVGKNAKEIEDYLVKLGEANFGDAMANRMQTLDGAMSNLGDEWNKLFLNISKAGIGTIIADYVRSAIAALEELNAQIVSGELVGYLRAIGIQFQGFADDARAAFTFVLEEMRNMEVGGKDAIAFLTDAFRQFPENVRAFIGLMTVHVAAGFDKASAYARAFRDGISAIFNGQTFAGVGAELERELQIINDARDQSTDSILAQRDATIKAAEDQRTQAKLDRIAYEEKRKAEQGSTADRPAQFKIQGEQAAAASKANKGAAAEAKKAAAEAKQLYQEQKKIASERLRADSQAKILAMELERIEASKLPTLLARAEAELAIDRRVMAERINLKKQEIAAIRADKEASAADIIRAEAELAALEVEAVRQEHGNLATVARERLAEVSDAWRLGTASIEEYTAALAAAREVGVLTEKQLSDLKIASGNDMGAAFGLGLEKAKLRMQTDAEMMIQIGEGLADRLSDGLVSAWDGFLSGTMSAKDALIDFARSTINWLSQVILKQMLMNALVGASGASGGGLFGMLGLASGGPVGAYASGGPVAGWSPSPTADNIPAWLTAREFVQPVRAVDYYGLAFMERIRRLQFPRHIAHALAGGTIPRVPSGIRLNQGGMAAAGQTTVKTGDTKLKVVNVLDSNLVGDYLRTADGETAIINMIRRNGTTIRTLIGG